RNLRDEKLLAAILELGHSLDLEVLAEGVETHDQLDWLRVQGFDYAQGFLIGRPLPPSATHTLRPRVGVALEPQG
ncbi:EAL domain-containing protein, partial [Escherichia coli]|nr:EAL domain-containing protein [Escherichia coli]